VSLWACRLGGEAGEALDNDEAVGAVIDDGNLTGLVGDFGLGLWNALLEIVGFVLFVAAALVEATSD
jgi:hypothetical protein